VPCAWHQPSLLEHHRDGVAAGAVGVVAADEIERLNPLEKPGPRRNRVQLGYYYLVTSPTHICLHRHLAVTSVDLAALEAAIDVKHLPRQNLSLEVYQ
jgi:hypothetical protein